MNNKPITKDDLPDCRGILCLIAYEKIPPCSIFDPEQYPVRELNHISGLTNVYDFRNHYFQCYETTEQNNKK